MVFGESKNIGNGSVRTWVHPKEDGSPDAVGIAFTETVLAGLPSKKPTNGMGGYEYTPWLPKEAATSPFDHVVVDWDPEGHVPAPIYTVPHFDFHFYMMKTAKCIKIDNTGKDLALCQKKPAPEFMPKNYMYAPQREIKYMGSHWVDVNTPKLHGKPFTYTFIYGSYNGKVAFFEPMVTMEYLRSKPGLTADIPQPAMYDAPGMLFPTKYHVSYDAARREYTVVLSDLIKR